MDSFILTASSMALIGVCLVILVHFTTKEENAQSVS